MKTLYECTPWFNAKVHKPVRVGWYEVKLHEGRHYFTEHMWYWDGRSWRWSAEQMTPNWVMRSDQWRGLTKEWK